MWDIVTKPVLNIFCKINWTENILRAINWMMYLTSISMVLHICIDKEICLLTILMMKSVKCSRHNGVIAIFFVSNEAGEHDAAACESTDAANESNRGEIGRSKRRRRSEQDWRHDYSGLATLCRFIYLLIVVSGESHSWACPFWCRRRSRHLLLFDPHHSFAHCERHKLGDA